MTRLLVRLFIKDYKNTSNFAVRERYGKLSGIVGIITNFLLFVIKIIAGTLFHSIAITADAVNNLSDSGSSVVTLIGFKISGKPADEEHPYGHARMEYISGLIVSFVILVLGLQLGKTSIEKIISPEASEFSLVMIAVLIISILIKVWQCLFYRKMSKTISSTTLLATSTDSLNDVCATSAVLIGTLITRFTGFNLDGYMGVLVAVFILLTGIKLVKETTDPLLGMAPSTELVDSIYEKIMAYDGIMGMHDLSVHNYGSGRCFASVHCEVPASRDIMISHDIIDNIERDFLKDMNIHMVIHLDPIVTDDAKTNELKIKTVQVLHELSPQIGIHDFRVVWGTSHSNLIFDVLVPFCFQWNDDQLTAMITDKIHEIDETYHAVITVDHDYVPRHGEATK